MEYNKPYTIITLLSGKTYYLNYPVSEIAGHLPLFLYQCNQSEIINLWQVKYIRNEKPGLVTCLNNGKRFVVSKRKCKEIKDRYKLVRKIHFRCDQCTDDIQVDQSKYFNNCMMTGNLMFCNKELVIIEKNAIYSYSYHEIVSIIADKPFVMIRTIHKEYIRTRAVLSQIIRHLPHVFFRCNRSDIVNLIHITIFEKKNASYLLYTIHKNIFSVSRQNAGIFDAKWLYIKELNISGGICLCCKLAPVCKKNLLINISV